jgi:hypothetical protein
MVESPTEPVSQILTEIQESMRALRSEVGTLRSELTPRLDRIENVVRKQRRDAAAMMVIMQATVGDFDERVSEIEEQIAALDASTS